MSGIKMHQKLPNNWEDREKLRNKGQFWTPSWVAQAMVEYVIENSDLVFDPATGKGAFYDALKKCRRLQKKPVKFYGIDIDEKVINEGTIEGYYNEQDCILEVRDFIFNPPKQTFKSIVANPPYIRHHRLDLQTKAKLKEISQRVLGFTIDSRAGLHVYFLVQALNVLEKEGKLAFIMPADTCEGIFAARLWDWIAKRYYIECVINFSPEATPFPNVDTNPIVFLIANKKTAKQLSWVISKKANTYDLRNFIQSKFKKSDFPSLEIINRDLGEALKTGLSRSPQKDTDARYKLADFARVMRGIATGANEFFHLTKEQAIKLNIPEEYLKPAIGRTRDIEGSYVDSETLRRLDEKGRPTLLLSLDGKETGEFPEEIRKHILSGEKLKLNMRSLIKTRKPWYKMEKREIPDFLFAYLGRRNARFIKNNANVLVLTGFLCIYSKSKNRDYIEKLWQILQHAGTVDNLRLVGKTYGGGAIKVEPRAMDNLPIPEHLVEKYKLEPIKDTLF